MSGRNPRLSHRQKRGARDIADRHQTRPGIVNRNSIPLRDEDDAYGNPFLGFTRRIIAFRELTEEEQADNSTTTRVLATFPHSNDPLSNSNINDDDKRAVSGAGTKTLTFDSYHMKTGMMTKRLFGSADNPDIPAGVQVPVAQLRGAGQNIADDLIPKRIVRGDADGILSYTALKDRPDLSKFLTSNDIENRATYTWVKNYIIKHVKPSARR